MAFNFLKALVKAFDKPHIVRAENSGNSGFKVKPVDVGQKALGRIELPLDESGVKDQFRLLVRDLCLPPALDLTPHRLEASDLHQPRACQSS